MPEQEWEALTEALFAVPFCKSALIFVVVRGVYVVKFKVRKVDNV